MAQRARKESGTTRADMAKMAEEAERLADERLRRRDGARCVRFRDVESRNQAAAALGVAAEDLIIQA